MRIHKLHTVSWRVAAEPAIFLLLLLFFLNGKLSIFSSVFQKGSSESSKQLNLILVPLGVCLLICLFFAFFQRNIDISSQKYSLEIFVSFIGFLGHLEVMKKPLSELMSTHLLSASSFPVNLVYGSPQNRLELVQNWSQNSPIFHFSVNLKINFLPIVFLASFLWLQVNAAGWGDVLWSLVWWLSTCESVCAITDWKHVYDRHCWSRALSARCGISQHALRSRLPFSRIIGLHWSPPLANHLPFLFRWRYQECWFSHSSLWRSVRGRNIVKRKRGRWYDYLPSVDTKRTERAPPLSRRMNGFDLIRTERTEASPLAN